MNYTELKGVPVFKTGRIRGETYTKERLRRMVRNSNRMRPYFRGVIRTKVTHDGEQPTMLDKAALGQTARYYLKGDYVMADFSGVPAELAQAAPHHFPNVSVEKYRYFEPGDGARVPDVIKAVAFLGADAPEVKGLKMAYPALFRDARGDIETFQMEEANMLGEQIQAWRESLAMSPDDAAAIWGISPDEIAKIESGEMEPDDTLLAKIAESFGLNADDLKGGKMPGEPPATFSEADVKRMIADAVAKAVSPMKQQIATLSAKAQKTEADLFAERQAAKTREICAMIDGWKANGLPAVLQTMGLETFMAKLDNQTVETFAEGETQTPLQWFKAFVEKFQEVGVVPLGERAKADPNARERDDVTQIEQYAEQHKINFRSAASALAREGKLKLDAGV